MRICLILCSAVFALPVLAQSTTIDSPPAVVRSLFLGMPMSGNYTEVADYCHRHDFIATNNMGFKKEFVVDTGFDQRPDSVLLLVYLTSGSRPDSAGMMRMLGYNVVLVYRDPGRKKRADKEFAALRSRFHQALGDEIHSEYRDDQNNYRKWKIASYWLDSNHKRAPVTIQYTIRNASPDKVDITINYTSAFRR